MIRVDNVALSIHRHGIDREISPLKVFLERYCWVSMHDKTVIAGP